MTENPKQGTKQFENTLSSAVDGMQEYNLKVLQIARDNADAAFDYAQQVISVKSPSELVSLWTEHAHKQFDSLTEQSKELAALGKKVSVASVEPITRGAAKAFSKVA